MTEINFEKELLKLGITLDEIKIQQFETYFKLLVEWNEKINLTSIVNREDVYLKHFYDSATLTKMVDLNVFDGFILDDKTPEIYREYCKSNNILIV